MLRNFVVVFFLCCIFPSLAIAQRAKLVGRWQSEWDPGQVVDLRADGTATTVDGETKWSVQGNFLQVGDLPMIYRLAGNRIYIVVGIGQEVPYKKLGPPSKASSKRNQSNTSPGDSQLQKLLLSSAWCSFKYNQITGTSSTSRAVFYQNGTLSLNSGAETYSSGYGGNYAGQSSGSGTMSWKVKNGRLFVNSGNGFEDLNLRVSQNSSGNPVLTASGKEYVRCQ